MREHEWAAGVGRALGISAAWCSEGGEMVAVGVEDVDVVVVVAMEEAAVVRKG